MTSDPPSSSSSSGDRLKRKEAEPSATLTNDGAGEKVAKLSPITLIDNVFSSFLDSWNIQPKRAHFLWFMSQQLHREYCHIHSDVDRLIRLLFDASSDLHEDTNWDDSLEKEKFLAVYETTTSGRTFLQSALLSSNSLTNLSQLSSTSSSVCLEAIEIIRPKSKQINWNHARIQPLNWACRRGHLDLLRFLIDEISSVDDLFSDRIDDGNKLFVGAIVFAVLSGNIEMVNYVCRDLGLDPNRGPKDWEPVLVVFGMEIKKNWPMLLALIKGGASLYHTNTNNLCTMRHMYISGWGWDPETRLDTLLGLLFLGTPFFEDNQLVYPAETITRDYTSLFPIYEDDIRTFVCWNDSYDYVLRYIGMAREYFKAATVTTSNDDMLPPPPPPLPPIVPMTNTQSGALTNSTRIQEPLPSFTHGNRSVQSRGSQRSTSENGSKAISGSKNDDYKDSDDDEDDDVDEDDDFSDMVEESLYAFEEKFLRQMRRQWMNSVAVLMRRRGLFDDHIDLVFAYILPYY